MHGIRTWIALLALAGLLTAQGGGKTDAPPPKGPPPVKKALNKEFKGRMEQDDWIDQAKELHFQKYGGGVA